MSAKKKELTPEEMLQEALVPEEEQPYKVPENWVWVRFGAIIKIKSGDFLVKKEMYADGAFPVYGGNGINGCHNKYNVDKETIVLGRVGFYCGSIHLTLSKSWVTDNALIVLTSWHLIDKKFLLLLLKYLNLRQYSNSTAQPVISAKAINPIALPLPPFKEQKRIVARVESLLGKINQAKELIAEARETFIDRRAAILAKAFRGELTREWRAKNKNRITPEELWNKIKKERFEVIQSKRELNDVNKLFEDFDCAAYTNSNNWLFLKANMFCHNIDCGRTPTQHISNNEKIPFLKVYNIVNNKIDFDYKPQFIPQEIHDNLKKSILHPNDVIMNIVGPPLKKIAVIPSDYPEWNMNQALVRFRPVKSVLPKYVYYCLQYDETLKDVINETRGVVGQSNISVSQSRNLVMPIPSIDEQAEIIKILDSLLEKEEELLNNNLCNIELKTIEQSISSKALRGQLGTNDPNEKSALRILKEYIFERAQDAQKKTN